MTDKSHVTLEQKLCPVCGKPHDTGAILLDQRIRPIFERYTVTGWELCPEHRAKLDEGYVALVECREKATGLNDAYRTGTLAFVRASAWSAIFRNKPLPKGGVVLVEVGVIDALQKIPVEGE